MKRGLLVLGLLTLGVGPWSRAAEAPIAPYGVPNGRFSYGKIEWVDKCITCKRLEWREERLERPVTRKLSRASVETLAIIAYHQPVTRAEIEQVRGVGLSKGTLDLLFDQNWI